MEECCRTNMSNRLPSACQLSPKLRPSPKFHRTRGLPRHEYESRKKRSRINVWESIRTQALTSARYFSGDQGFPFSYAVGSPTTVMTTGVCPVVSSLQLCKFDVILTVHRR